MPVGYRALMQLETDFNVLEVAETEFISWLAQTKKIALSGLDVPFGVSQISLEETVCKSAIADSSQSVSGVSLVYSQVTPQRTWSVFLHGIESSNFPQKKFMVAEVDVTLKPGESATEIAAPPNLVKRILQKYEVSDGASRLVAPLEVINSNEQVLALVSEIRDPSRKITINVAPSQGDEFDQEWQEIVESLASWGVGNSSTYVVRRQFVAAFNKQIGDSLSVPPGFVRSYQPQIDVSDPEDALRHRYLKTANLQKSIFKTTSKWKVSASLQKAFARASRLRFSQVGPFDDFDTYLAKARTSLSETVKNARLTQTATTPAADNLGEKDRESSVKEFGEKGPESTKTILKKLETLVQRFLGRDMPAPSGIDGIETWLVSELSEKKEVENLFNKSENELKTKQTELESVLEAADNNEKRNRYLEKLNKQYRERLFQKGTQSSDSTHKWDEVPFMMEDLLARISPEGDAQWAWLREKVVFTGDEKTLLLLDEKSAADRYVSITWDYIEVLYDFASLKSDRDALDGGMDYYLKNPDLHSGRVTGSVNHSSESDSVKNRPKLNKSRLLPVPKSVNPLGEVFMWDHFKIDGRDSISPRLHYFFDQSNTGRVYIGYIGKHLPLP